MSLNLKGLKQYEKIALLERKISYTKNKQQKYANVANNLKIGLKKMVEYQTQEEKALKKEIEFAERDAAKLFDELKALERVLINVKKRPVKRKTITVKPLETIKIEDVIKPTPKEKALKLIEEVESRQEAAMTAAATATEKIEEALFSIDTIPQTEIDEYEEETGRKAIWRGVITNGFKDFIAQKNGDEPSSI